jgi:hypothetical protein
MNVRRLLLPLACLAALSSACAGGGTGGNAAGGGGGGGGGTNAGSLPTTVDTSGCTEAPEALSQAVSAKLKGITLSHVFVVKQDDGTFYLSGRMEGPSQAGNDVATFELTSDDPTSASVSAVGPNATNYSEWPAGTGSTDDPAAKASNLCARTK